MKKINTDYKRRTSKPRCSSFKSRSIKSSYKLHYVSLKISIENFLEDPKKFLLDRFVNSFDLSVLDRHLILFGEQGWCSGEQSPPTNVVRVRFRSGAMCGLSLLLVLALL